METLLESRLSHGAEGFWVVFDFAGLAHEPFARRSVEAATLRTDRTSASARALWLLTIGGEMKDRSGFKSAQLRQECCFDIILVLETHGQ